MDPVAESRVEKAAGLALLAAALLAPLIDAPGFGFDTLRLPILASMAIVFLAIRAGRPGTDASPDRWPWALGLALVAFQVVSWRAAVDLDAAADATVRVLPGFLMYAAVSRRWISVDRLPWIVGAAAILEGGVALAGKHWPVPLLGNTNYAGCALCGLVVACLAWTLEDRPRGERLYFGIGAIMAAAGLWRSDSRAGLVGLAAGAVVVLLRGPGSRKAKAWIAASLLLGGGIAAHERIASIFSTTIPTNRVRLELWKGTLSLSAANPLMGCGAGNFRSQFPPFRGEAEAAITDAGKLQLSEAEDPHNTHLSVLSELGGPAFAAWIAWLGLAFVRAWRSKSTVVAAVIATFATAGCFNTLREFSPFDLWIGIWVGVAARGSGDAGPRSRWGRGLELAALLPFSMALAWSLAGALSVRAYDAGMRSADAVARRDAMERALWWRPHSWLAHLSLSTTYATVADTGTGPKALEMHRKALDHAEAALEAVPWSLPVLNVAARSATATGDTDHARALLERAERIAPWYYLTQIHFAPLEATPEAAYRRLRRALELKPQLAQDPDFLRLLK